MSAPGSGNVPPAVAHAEAALSYIEEALPGIDAVSAMLNQRARPDGTIYDVMDIGWKILPQLVDDFAAYNAGAGAVKASATIYQNTYYSHPDASKDWPSIAINEIHLKVTKVLSIYAGLNARYPLPPWDA